jgi:hypothetical protein
MNVRSRSPQPAMNANIAAVHTSEPAADAAVAVRRTLRSVLPATRGRLGRSKSVQTSESENYTDWSFTESMKMLSFGSNGGRPNTKADSSVWIPT